MRQRPCAIIIKDDKILVMKRFRDDDTYFTFPGGHVEDRENLEQTLKRETKEELNFDIINFKEIFRITDFNPRYNDDVESIFYLITDFSGELKLGGPEIERMKTGKNNYYPEWYNRDEFNELSSVYPTGIKEYVLSNIL